jgi:hypothetical protein
MSARPKFHFLAGVKSPSGRSSISEENEAAPIDGRESHARPEVIVGNGPVDLPAFT